MASGLARRHLLLCSVLLVLALKSAFLNPRGLRRTSATSRKSSESESAGESVTTSDARKLLDSAWQLSGSSDLRKKAAEAVEPGNVQPGAVLLADPRRFAAAATRAGAGMAGVLPSPTDWLLRGAAMLGQSGLELVADLSRWRPGNWMPVVLVTAVGEDGSAEGVALTARTGILLGDIDYEGALAFATRPLHWGGPEEGPVTVLHDYADVPGARPLAQSGLFVSGSIAKAADWLQGGGIGSSLRFRFFSNRVRWSAGELPKEVQDGTWIPIRASRDLVLDESQSVGATPLWGVLARLLGGEAEELGRSYDLLG